MPDAAPAAPNALRVLVVDDEPLARQRLLDLMEREPGIEVVAAVGSGREAVDRLRADTPDLVFLDVQMPGLTGLDVVREVGAEAMPVTVFVTAFDQHAVEAFELAAVDYLLKPFEDERFYAALARARETVRLREVDALQGRLRALLQPEASPEPGAPEPAAPEPEGYLERIAVEMRGQIRVVPVERVDYIAADGAYAEVHVGDETFVIRTPMQALEARLDPAHFVRIHRSTIVRLDRVEAILVAGGGDYAVQLRDGPRLRLSRTRREALESRLGLDTGR